MADLGRWATDDEERQADREDEVATTTAERLASPYPEGSPQKEWMREHAYNWSIAQLEKRRSVSQR